MGAFSRFGVPANELNRCLPFLESSVKVVGFHAYMGSQLLPAPEVVRSLRAAVDLCDFAAGLLKLRPEELNLGGGFGIPYSEDETELDLEPIGRELERLCQEWAGARVSVELGRYIVGPCGWYLTRVVEKQSHDGRPAVVVDGGVHQRFDICGLNLSSRCQKPVVLGLEETDERLTVDVLGCLCMPSDILAAECELPPLAPGAVLAFPNSGAYGLTASPTGFLCHATPPEVALQEGKLLLLRDAGSPESSLTGQRRI
jgi:diaminopimelate decarboxylase